MFNELFRTSLVLRIPYRYKEQHQISLLGGLPGSNLKTLPSHIIENLSGIVKTYSKFFWVSGRYVAVYGSSTFVNTRHPHISSCLWVDFPNHRQCYRLQMPFDIFHILILPNGSSDILFKLVVNMLNHHSGMNKV